MAQQLDDAVRGAGSNRASGELSIAVGVAEALAEEASQPGGLLVIPSHGKGALAATLVGSVAERAMKLATELRRRHLDGRERAS